MGRRPKIKQIIEGGSTQITGSLQGGSDLNIEAGATQMQTLPGQLEPKPKRKYTKRVKKEKVIKGVDLNAIVLEFKRKSIQLKLKYLGKIKRAMEK